MHNHEGFNKVLDGARIEYIKEYFIGKSVINVGAGNGHMEKNLVKMFDSVTSFEPNKENYDKIKSTISHYKGKPDCKIEIINSKVEDDTKERCVDSILCCNVLEHIEPKNVPKFLSSVMRLGNKDSVFIFSIPNPQSYNRILGDELGMLKSPEELSVGDISIGHKQMYKINELFDVLTDNGFKVSELYTRVYKPFHNELMFTLPFEVIDFCMNLKMVDKGAEIFCIAKKGD